MFTGIGLIAFCCIFGAGVAGLLLRTILPEVQRTDATQKTVQTPRLFLVVVIFWLSILFISYTTFAPINATIITAVLAGAFSVSIALNLIFDMDRPFADSSKFPQFRCSRRWKR